MSLTDQIRTQIIKDQIRSNIDVGISPDVSRETIDPGIPESFATTPEPASTLGRSFGVAEPSDLRVEIPRISPEGIADPRGKAGALTINTLAGLAELPLNIPSFALSLLSKPSQLSPVKEGKAVVPQILKDIVTPIAKLAAGETVRGESEAGKRLSEEARKESFERPEGPLMPFLIAGGGPKAVKGIGRLAKRLTTPKGKKAVPTVERIIEPTEPIKPGSKITEELLTTPDRKAVESAQIFETELGKRERLARSPREAELLKRRLKAGKTLIPDKPVTPKAPQKPVVAPEEVLGAVAEKPVVAPEVKAKPAQKLTPKGGPSAILGEMTETIRGSIETIKKDISGVRDGPIEGGKGTILFEFRGKTYKAPEPIDVIIGTSSKADISIATRLLLDKKAKITTAPKLTPKGKERITIDEASSMLGDRKPHELTLNEYNQYLDAFRDVGIESEKFVKPHKQYIEQALSEGKPVPESVLKDYPELAEGAVIPTPKKPVSGVQKKPAVAETPKEAVKETAEATLAIRTEAEAIAKKMTEDFGDLPEYKTMNMKEQARQALDVINKDYKQAKRMAMGEESPPSGLREASIYEAVKLRALKEGDVQTLMELATESKIPTKLSEYGQAIKAADSEIMNDPVRVMQDIGKIRAERSKRTGKKATDKEIDRLRTELETLQKAFDERVAKVTKRKPVKYGSKNTIVDQATYDKAKLEISRTISELGANPFANPKVIADAVKIGTYHLEAGSRLFADWSVRMVSDLGENVKPHLGDMWKKINEDKKLRTALKAQKTRLARETETLTGKLETLDLTRPERRKLKLDKEAKRLKKERDRAKENLEAARSVSGTITKTEAENIVRLSDATEKARIEMEKGGDRLKYGTARVIQERYVNSLKGEDGPLKTQLRQRVQEFKTTFKDGKLTAISDLGKDVFDLIFDTSIAMVASWDNSFIGRQGIKTFYRNKKIWGKAALSSFADFGKTIGGKRAHDALLADIYSRENFLNGNYQKAKILAMVEEEIPTSLPGRIPILGRVFKASESAFTGSGMRMRTSLFDFLNEKAKRNGVDVTSKAHLEDMGSLINSMTGRGKLGKSTGRSRFLRVAMWAPKLLKGNWDVLTGHTFGFGLKTKFARKEAALNITKMAIEVATILKIADTLSPGSVEWDSNSAAFGAIKSGDTFIDITGGMKGLVTLGSRLITGKRKNLKGKNIEFGPGFAESSRFDAVVSFAVNKTPPVTRAAIDLLKGVDFNFEPVTPLKTIKGVIAPITVQQALELGDEVSADRVLGVILDAVGVSSFSVTDHYQRMAKASKAGRFDEFRELKKEYEKTGKKFSSRKFNDAMKAVRRQGK